ncbi:tRNA (carboxymethyluridine(34)-5-O)-methyltransferase [Neolecta irregularis DAH-3]|uniref:tRNA (Carboxymethyluridine(34)-5-O)-methyltransferase n=1 Tax=Neolecta irregularis (strain DAH-3) TaxID=1198029 RepID=A0A1U7LHG4_NEOID|nr:tRNA (carboxymethyluridine(34)-5-O)-methyltransferase [Neolecta irregularis DAH-3]|eukprot:OLL22068.1 tRNA (carboxymethyluridine(34)-5-O)-methyltransferase [Neolecta irregularis DAH-3]
MTSTGIEKDNVHAVYQQIAGHFSQTRHTPWPIVKRFLEDQNPGAIGLDVGCGNGKYLDVNNDILIIGSDRSSNLVDIARTKGEAVVSDGIAIPHPASRFDFCLSVAVIHHFSTTSRRMLAISSLLQTLLSNGRLLIYVWALEQKSSRRGWDEDCEQDVMVPWVNPQGVTYQRYYHLYRKGELEYDVSMAGGKVLESGYEKDNWWAICERNITIH